MHDVPLPTRLRALQITLGLLSSRCNHVTSRAVACSTSGVRGPPLCAASSSGSHRQRSARMAAADGLGTGVMRTAEPLSKPDARRAGGSCGSFGRVEQALQNRQPEAACREFVDLVRAGRNPSPPLCDRLVYELCGRHNWAAARHAYAAIMESGLALKYGAYQQLMSTAIKASDLSSALDILQDMRRQGLAINRVTYCSLISACGKQRRRGVRYMQIAYELWQELVRSGAHLDGAAFRAGMKACVDMGKQDEAWGVLAQMLAAGEQPDVRAYNILLKGHSRNSEAGALDLTLQRMAAAGVQPTAVTYNTLIDGYVRSGAMGEAERCAAKAQEAGVRLDAWSYSTLIKGHVQRGNMTAAVAVLETMRGAGVAPTCVTFSTLIDGHVRQGDLEAARRLLVEMVVSGERPSVVTYNSLLRGYAMRQPASVKQALALLSEMQAAGVAPSTDTFNTLMAVAMAADNPELCMQLWARLQAAGLPPDALTYTTAIQAHARLRQPMEALAVFQRLSADRNAQMDLAAYSALVDALSLSGDMESAERMLKVACSFAEQQGKPPPVEAFGAVVTGYARQMSVHKALATVRRYLALGGSPDAQMLDILFDTALRTGEYKVAMQAVRAMELVGQKVDKEKYRALLERRLPSQQSADLDGRRQGHNRTWADYQRRRQSRHRNVHLQRLLFWLGISTAYYDESSEEEEEEERFY